MKRIKKIVAITTLTILPITTFALEAMEDDAMEEVSGQEGITIDQSYGNTIEQFQYIDGDGDGSGETAGQISVTDIQIGDLSNAACLTDCAVGQQIDATDNGVIIGNPNIGPAAGTLPTTPAPLSFAQGRQYNPQSRQFSAPPAVMGNLGDRIVR